MRPLDGVRFKLTRAQEHADTLNEKITAFLERKPYLTGIDVNEDTWEFTLTMKVRETPNPYWGVYVGDFLHNVRSALDHLMCALVLANGKRVTKQTQFPIFTDKYRFEVIGEPMMRGASSEARAVIEELQPYHRLHPDEHPLEVLRVFSNKDKHQLLFGAIITPKELEQRVTEAFGSHRIEVDEIAGQRPLEHDTVILRGRVVPGADFENVKMKLQLVGEVVLSDGTSFDTAEFSLVFVRERVVPRFESFAEPRGQG